MNITDKYNLSIGTANLNKLNNTKREYQNYGTKFSIENAPEENVTDKEFQKKRLREVSEDFESLMINQMLKEMRKTIKAVWQKRYLKICYMMNMLRSSLKLKHLVWQKLFITKWKNMFN